MPKIAKGSTSVNIGGKQRYFQYEINYSTNIGAFYAVIPGDLEAPFALLTDEEKKELHATELSRYKYKSSGRIGFGVTGPSVDEVTRRINTLIDRLVKSSIQRRSVILVWYDGELSTQHANVKNTFPNVKVALKFMYAQEATIEGGKPGYYQIYGTDWESRIDMGYRWEENTIVLPDTKHNREYLEKLYDALDNLRLRLDGIMDNSVSLSNAISSNIKLLS
jgi:hypothetical protein